MKNYNKILFKSILTVLFLGLILTGIYSVVKAQTPPNVRGWVWSDNIGWISMGSGQTTESAGIIYGVNMDASNVFSGWAWSDNIGWIKFDPSLTGPSGNGVGARAVYDASASTTALKVYGWVRACAGTVSGTCVGGTNGNEASRVDGWDGWINFGESALPRTYGTFLSLAGTPRQISGFVWGSDVVGWSDTGKVIVTDGIGNISVSISGGLDGLYNGNTSYTFTSAGQNKAINVAWHVTDISGSVNPTQVNCRLSTSNTETPNFVSTLNSNAVAGPNVLAGSTAGHGTSTGITISSNTGTNRTYTYTCSDGLGHSSSASITFNLPQYINGTDPADNGICGTADNKIYSVADPFPNGFSYCQQGTPSPLTPSNPTPGNPSEWTCLKVNSNGVDSPQCSASRQNGGGSCVPNPPGKVNSPTLPATQISCETLNRQLDGDCCGACITPGFRLLGGVCRPDGTIHEN
ncbi:MAG: hypothetical protein Q7R78_00600 [bacterium]|nr:hypothetical protein [bacterium]